MGVSQSKGLRVKCRFDGELQSGRKRRFAFAVLTLNPAAA